MEKKQQVCFLTFVRPRDVQVIYGVSRQTIWRYVRAGKLEPPKQVSAGVVGWNRVMLDSFFGIK